MKDVLKSIRNQLIAGAVLFTFIGIGYAVDLPNLFSPNTPIKSSEVNADFNSLKTAVDTLEAKVNALGANLPLPSKKGKIGYAVVGIDGSLLTNYSYFNSTGGAVNVDHISTGNYEVTFVGLSDPVDLSTPVPGTIQVTPFYATFNCGVVVTSSRASRDMKGRVECRDHDGNLTNAAYSILMIN